MSDGIDLHVTSEGDHTADQARDRFDAAMKGCFVEQSNQHAVPVGNYLQLAGDWERR